MKCPFYDIIDTPENRNVVSIMNTATIEFPLTCSVGAYSISNKNLLDEIQLVIRGYGAENHNSGPGYNIFRYGGEPVQKKRYYLRFNTTFFQNLT